MESILRSSLAFSVLAIAVLAFRRFRGARYSKRLMRALWVMVILRMLIPFSLTSSLAVIHLPQNFVTERFFIGQKESISPSTNAPEPPITIGQAPVVESGGTGMENSEEPLSPQAISPLSNETKTASTGLTSWSLDQILLIVWAAGGVVSLIILGLSYRKFRRDLRNKLQTPDPAALEAIQSFLGSQVQVLVINSDESPMVVGVLRPILVLPKRLLTGIDSSGVLSTKLLSALRHENAHIQSKDLLLKSLYLVGRAVQWFNPLAYLIHQPLNEDIEMAADETATKGMERGERGAYCQSILEVAEKLPVTANNYSTHFTGDLNSMKKRIESLFNADNNKRGLAVLITFLIAVALTFGLVSCVLEPVEPVENDLPPGAGLTTVGNLLTTADTCKDFYLTVGTEFEIEYDQENFPAYGENPTSPLDTTGAIHQLGTTVNQAADTYRYQFKAVSPGTLTMTSPGIQPPENEEDLPFSGALFSFIVIDDKEAEELGVEPGQLVRPAALPGLENDYSLLEPEHLIREYYRLLNAGRPDQAYQLRLSEFQCQLTPTLFTRMHKENHSQTEVLSAQAKTDWDKEHSLESSDDLGDLPGVCERLIVEKRVTGVAGEEQYPEEVVFVTEDGAWKIASIADPTCCRCNAYHEKQPDTPPESLSVVRYGELVLYQYHLEPLPDTDGALEPLTWEGEPINTALAGKPLKYLKEKIVIGEHTYFAHCNPEKSDCIAQVEKDGEVIFEILSQNPQEIPVVLGTIRSFWKLDDSWVLEVAREWNENPEADPMTALPAGEIYLDGELINQRYDYETAFEFQVLDGKPFFFFKRNGKLGFSYDWQEYTLPFNSVHHYRCCSAGINNPRHFENLVNFVVVQDDEWQYYELVLQK